jgi:hypothetical protein
MEGSARGFRRPLAVQREFVSSRLERQVLMRAYELAVPVICRCIAPVSQTNAKARTVRLVKGESQSQPIAKGA